MSAASTGVHAEDLQAEINDLRAERDDLQLIAAREMRLAEMLDVIDCPPGTCAQSAHKKAQNETLRRCGRDRVVQTPRRRPQTIVFCGRWHMF